MRERILEFFADQQNIRTLLHLYPYGDAKAWNGGDEFIFMFPFNENLRGYSNFYEEFNAFEIRVNNEYFNGTSEPCFELILKNGSLTERELFVDFALTYFLPVDQQQKICESPEQWYVDLTRLIGNTHDKCADADKITGPVTPK